MSQSPGRTVMPSVEITSAPARHREHADLPDRRDALALDEDDAVADRLAAESVDERAADERLRRWTYAGAATMKGWRWRTR